MSIAIETVRREALTLSPADRIALVDDLLASLDPTEPTLDARWIEEFERRYAAFKDGRMGAIDADEVFRDLRLL